jgi:hypothetical protein
MPVVKIEDHNDLPTRGGSALSAQRCNKFAVRQNNRCHAEADGRTQREAK